LEFDWRGLQQGEDTGSGSKVNRPIGECVDLPAELPDGPIGSQFQ
jgi:hypothetical protein